MSKPPLLFLWPLELLGKLSLQVPLAEHANYLVRNTVQVKRTRMEKRKASGETHDDLTEGKKERKGGVGLEVVLTKSNTLTSNERL